MSLGQSVCHQETGTEHGFHSTIALTISRTSVDEMAAPFDDLDVYLAPPRCSGLSLSRDGTRLIPTRTPTMTTTHRGSVAVYALRSSYAAPPEAVRIDLDAVRSTCAPVASELLWIHGGPLGFVERLELALVPVAARRPGLRLLLGSRGG